MARNASGRHVAEAEARVKSRYTPRQIMAFLREIDEGKTCSIAQACQRMNISRQTYYYWRQRYGHTTTSAPARLIVQLDRDIRRLSEQLAAQQALLDRLRDELDEDAEGQGGATLRGRPYDAEPLVRAFQAIGSAASGYRDSGVSCDSAAAEDNLNDIVSN